MRFISSLTHQSVKLVVRLHRSKERQASQLCLIEGVRALTTALAAGLVLEELYCTKEQLTYAQTIVPDGHITCVTDALMEKISCATTPSGILGIFQIPPAPPASALTQGIVLAQITDPGNMGTLIRTAVSCNIRSVVIVEGVDPWSPKVLQASAGTVALVQIFRWSWEELLQAKGSLQLCALVVAGGKSARTIESKTALIVVGNEARGLPTSWLNRCDTTITLPMPGNTESLNAAIAGSIALYLTFIEQ